MYAPELNDYRLTVSFRTDLEVVHQRVPDAEVRAMEIMLAPWGSNVDTEAIIARFPNVVHVRLAWLGHVPYRWSTLPFEEWAGIVRRAAAIPGLETVTVSLSSLDSSGELHAAYLREFRAKYVQVNSVLTLPALERALRPVPSAAGVGFINNAPYDDPTPLLRSLQAKRHPYYKIVMNAHSPEVLGLLHPGLLGFSMELRRDRVSMTPQDFDALALGLRGCPRLRELSLGWRMPLDERGFDAMALTVAGLQLELAHFRCSGTPWGIPHITLLNAMVRSERVRSGLPGVKVPGSLATVGRDEEGWVARVRQSVVFYEVVRGSGVAPPELLLKVSPAAFAASERLVLALRQPLPEVAAYVRRMAAAGVDYGLPNEARA